MSNIASATGRTFLAIALMPASLLTACGSSSDQATVEQQVAIAKDAADRAITAQKAAERAASIARSQSGSSSFGDDESIEEIDDSPTDDSDSSEVSSYSSSGEGAAQQSSNPAVPR